MKKRVWFIGALIGMALVAVASNSAFAQASNCRATAAAPTYNEGALSALSCDLTGNLRSSGGGGGGGNVNVNQWGGVATTLGQKAMAASVPVVVSSDQSALPINNAQWGGVATTLGQKAMASSVPVVVSSDQSALPVSQNGTWTVQPGNNANTTPWLVTSVPSSATAVGITPVVSTALETGRVLKAGAGNLYSLNVTTTSVAGYVMTFNSTTVPAAGAVTPIHCVPIAQNSSVSISYGAGPPAIFSTGISAAFSTTGCFTKTDSATAFFNGAVK